MLAKLEILLEVSEKISTQMSSLFQGALMELLPFSYAEKLHNLPLNPYTQHIEKRKNDFYWIITTVDKEAYENIIEQTLLKTDDIYIKKRDIQVKLISKELEYIEKKELVNDFYKKDSERTIIINFKTPTAFKQNGMYNFFPDLSCIYQSLMNKYDVYSDGESTKDDDTLLELVRNSKIVSYDIKSIYFHIEGIKIPGYVGKIKLKIKGPQTLCNFINLLLRFGEYSGIGIKSSMGMGYINLIKGGNGFGRKSD